MLMVLWPRSICRGFGLVPRMATLLFIQELLGYRDVSTTMI